MGLPPRLLNELTFSRGTGLSVPCGPVPALSLGGDRADCCCGCGCCCGCCADFGAEGRLLPPISTSTETTLDTISLPPLSVISVY